MTDENPTAPPADRHPRIGITRLPYMLVVVVVLIAAAIWGALTLRERQTSEREIMGVGANPAQVDQAIANPEPR